MSQRYVIAALIAVGLLSYLVFAPTAETVSSEELVARSVGEKLAAWQARRTKECRKRALEVAFDRADSLLLDYAREQKIMLDRPGRPERPVAPPLARPSDTLELRPFLQDSTD